jgi:hypothetical protein
MLTKLPPQILLCEPADHQSAGLDYESVNMGLLHGLRITVSLGAITGNDAVFKLYGGATSGTKTTAIPFKYRKSSADFKATGNDQYDALSAEVVAGTGLVLADATAWDHRQIVIDVESIDMPAGLPWLTVEVDDGSASGLLMSAVGQPFPRYTANNMPTVVA